MMRRPWLLGMSRSTVNFLIELTDVDVIENMMMKQIRYRVVVVQLEISNVQCYYCHERGTHVSAACPNSTVNVAMLNNNYKVNAANNAEADRMNPHKTFRFA